MKIYLDTSVYNRPFDDQTQPRIWLETMAFTIILQMVIESKQVDLVSSSVLGFENTRNPFPERKEWVNDCLKLSGQNVLLDTSIRQRALELSRQGIKPVDALHLACGESGQVNFFLTCDDKVVKRYRGKKMAVLNPVQFILKTTEEGKI